MSFIYDLTDTWNNEFQVFHGIKLDVTTVAYNNDGTHILHLLRNGESLLRLWPNGNFAVNHPGESKEIFFDGEEAYFASTGGVKLGNEDNPWRELHVDNLWLKPDSSLTPTVNGTMTIQATSNTQLTFKLRGSDGTVRSANLTLS